MAVAAVLLLAALLRCVPLGLSNPRFFHLDEWDFVQSAVEMWAEGTLDPGRYVHPALYRYAIAAFYPVVPQVIGDSERPELRPWLPYVTGRLVSAAMGVLAVWLVYRLARRLMPAGGALAAALVIALAPLHVQFSHIAKPDVMSATLVALATLLAWRLAEEPRLALYVWAGVAIGLAVAAKYSGIVAAVPVLVAHLIAWGRKTPRITRIARIENEAPVSSSVRGSAVIRVIRGQFPLLLAAGTSLAAFALASPYTLVNLAGSFREGCRILVAGQPDPEQLPQPPALLEVARQAWDWLGPATLALAAAGAVLLWREKRAALVVVGSVIVATVAMVSLWAVQQPFYLLPLVPAVAVLAGVPIAKLAARRWLAAGLLAACLVPSAVLSAREISRLWLPGTRQLAKAWLLANAANSPGNLLRDPDSLEATADEVLPIIDPGTGFYAKVDRAYLERQSITHFVLSDSAAATDRLTPEAASRRAEAHARLLDCGDALVRFPPSWWRDGPGITIYRVKDALLAEFAREREQKAKELRAKVKDTEDRLSARPGDAALHMQAGRLLSDQAATSRADEAVALWQLAEGHFAQAAAADPKLGDAHYNLGCLYLRVAAWATRAQGPEKAAGVFAKAAQAFRDAIAIDPAQADYHFNLGFALWSASRATPDEAARRLAEDEGTRAYRRAAELKPDIRIPASHILAVAERGPQPFH